MVRKTGLNIPYWMADQFPGGLQNKGSVRNPGFDFASFQGGSDILRTMGGFTRLLVIIIFFAPIFQGLVVTQLL